MYNSRYFFGLIETGCTQSRDSPNALSTLTAVGTKCIRHSLHICTALTKNMLTRYTNIVIFQLVVGRGTSSVRLIKRSARFQNRCISDIRNSLCVRIFKLCPKKKFVIDTYRSASAERFVIFARMCVSPSNCQTVRFLSVSLFNAASLGCRLKCMYIVTIYGSAFCL